MTHLLVVALTRLTVRLVAATVIGTATLLMMKPDPRTHWSIPPTKVIRIRGEDVGAADLFRRAGLRLELRLVMPR